MQKIDIQIEQVQVENEKFYKIPNVDKMRPFFMSIVSDCNHWMFIGSNGGLSAGRKDAENALFPYYTDDKIIESAETTGSKSIFQVNKDGQQLMWEPFSVRNADAFHIERNLYKNSHGNKILFEEVNLDLNLTFQYQWNSSNSYGFVRKAAIINTGSDQVTLSILDGIQNIMPYGVGSMLQNQRSNLVDAYKRNELKKNSSIGIFALSAIIVDKAEPSEALKGNIAWSIGLENSKYLLSSTQLDGFRKRLSIEEEHDIKAEKGAYFINADITLPANGKKDWMIIANVNQSSSTVAELSHALHNDPSLEKKINEDIELGTKLLAELNAAADGLQLTQDKLRDTRHFSNSLFNIMRGGIFDYNYQIEKTDIIEYLSNANKEVFEDCQEALNQLPEKFTLTRFNEFAAASENPNVKRLCIEYLPLKFSRRHGDPSRPWNQFSINTHNEDGSKILDYEGNWRDIFQNWEALAHSYPEFIEGMIFKFLNASTFDGYNPYRVTKSGIDWERIEPDDPWSYIGYWGDHQIIYLLKFLEFIQDHDPGKLASYFNKDIFVYANVPYKIKSYTDILNNPKDTIEFDQDLDNKITDRWPSLGADSALLTGKNGGIYQVNLIEKVLATVLAKLSNFIPEGGIWMNTQRPEWNDANNALVGNGVSMVTLCYLRRFLNFFNGLLTDSSNKDITISTELHVFFNKISDTLTKCKHLLSGSINDKDRKLILDGLGMAGSDYRQKIYSQSFGDKKEMMPMAELITFINTSLEFLEHTIRANRRTDGLFHAYNLMTVESQHEVSISYLSEMLEGQVAVLSSGYLSAEQALEVLDGLKRSALFRDDQYSYMLYPNKDLPGFIEKNNVAKSAIDDSKLLASLVNDGNTQIIRKDINGVYHFNGNFKNAGDLEEALNTLADKYSDLLDSGKAKVLTIFESVFNHKAFTGRSGTFFGYEGLGSIYWHMVSKLQLAVQECCQKALDESTDSGVTGRLLEHYYEINESIGVHKSPSLYGAFPTDPYSHTPAGKGAQQPGMTGQVKEDILSRFGELGIDVTSGQLNFNPSMLRKDEFLKQAESFKYVDINRQWKEIDITAGALSFTYCQIPIVYKLSDENHLEVILNDGTSLKYQNLKLDVPTSSKVFNRTGEVVKIIAHLNESDLL